MYWVDLIASYLHYVAIFGFVACLVGELALYRPPLDEPRTRVLGMIDLGYLVAAIVLMGAGFFRLWASPKTGAFFWRNGFFYVKLACATAIGTISLVPTMHFYRYGKALAAGTAQPIALAEERRVRGYIYAQLALACLMPLWGLLMARAFWLF